MSGWVVEGVREVGYEVRGFGGVVRSLTCMR